MTDLPAQLDFRMPAEWEPHDATWIAWPHHRDDWPDKFAPIPWVYAEIVRHLRTSEQVCILVNNYRNEQRVRQILLRVGVEMDRLQFFRFPTNRVWTRDYGPLFIIDRTGRLAATSWHFNAWAKYPNWQRDNSVANQIAATLNLPAWQPSFSDRHMVLEGGAIDVNGAGLLLTTEECLLSEVQQRNPDMTRQDYERMFADYLGVRKVLWLDRGIDGDDTHGHVDDVARFVGPRTVVAAVEKNPADANYRPLQQNLERLRGMTDLEGNALEIVPLPMPSPVRFDGRRLPASYANFYIGNTVVIAPTFNDPNDRCALGLLADLFPDRTVVGVHSVDLVWGFGTLHCLTQQQPARGGQSRDVYGECRLDGHHNASTPP